MKKYLATLLVLFLMMPLSTQAASKKPPKLVLLPVEVGYVSQPIEGEGTWHSEHPDIAAVSENGIITTHQEGYTLVLCTGKKGNVVTRCEVKVGNKPAPPEVQKVIDLAIADWAAADGAAFPKYNKYTQWYNPAAKNGFGWCGAFVGYHYNEVGVNMDKEFRAKNAPPLPDGSLFVVRQASQTKLFEGFESRNRLSNIPQPGYYIIYGRKGSTPYTHVGLVTSVTEMGEGIYMLETVEGNLNSRIKRYCYLYDSLAERKERNIKSLPEDMQVNPDVFNYKYVDNFYINVFGQTWY